MVHVLHIDQASYLDRHVAVSICWICNENLPYTFCNAIMFLWSWQVFTQGIFVEENSDRHRNFFIL